MRRSLLFLGLSVLLSLTAVVGNPSTGKAADTDCGADFVCVWDHPDYVGEMHVTGEPKPCWVFPIYSAVNNSSDLTLRLYQTEDCSGDSVATVAPGEQVPSFSDPDHASAATVE